jgi:nitrogen regulatory protein PII
MTDFFERDDFSLVTLIIPQAKLSHCLAEIQAHWPYNAIQFDCRGTLVREHRFQLFLPTINPECEFLQFMVKDLDVTPFMGFCAEVNSLHLPGAGAVFSSKSTSFTSNASAVADYCEHSREQTAVDEQTNKSFKSNLYAVYALIQSGRTEQAIKAAMQAGSHGPIVYFVEGRGTRDRAGWLKITKKPYEEVVMVLVEDIDRQSVIEALVTAGRVDKLGGGVVFDMPVGQGLVNLPTSVGNRSQRSSNEQITTAIDELMGGTDWRNRRTLEALMASSEFQGPQNHIGSKSVLLNAFLPRKYANVFLEQVLILGIPGANVTYAKRFSLSDDANDLGVHIHHELVQVRMVVSKEDSIGFSTALKQFVQEQEYDGVTIYEQELEQVIRYQLKANNTMDKTQNYVAQE